MKKKNLFVIVKINSHRCAIVWHTFSIRSCTRNTRTSHTRHRNILFAIRPMIDNRIHFTVRWTTIRQVLVLKHGLSVHFDCRRWHCGCHLPHRLQFSFNFWLCVSTKAHDYTKRNSQHRLTVWYSAHIRVAFGVVDTFSVSVDFSLSFAHSSRSHAHARIIQQPWRQPTHRCNAHNTPFIDE